MVYFSQEALSDLISIFYLIAGWLPQSVSEWKVGLEYIATMHEMVEKDSYLRVCEEDLIDKLQSKKQTEEIHTYYIYGRNMSKEQLQQENKNINNRNGLEIDGNSDGKLRYEKESLPKGAEFIETGATVKPKPGDAVSGNSLSKKSFKRLKQHTCMKSAVSAGHKSLNVDLKSYALIMLQRLGASQTLQIILDSQLQQNVLTKEFYYKCILSSQLQNHQRLVMCYLLLAPLSTHKCSSCCRRSGTNDVHILNINTFFDKA